MNQRTPSAPNLTRRTVLAGLAAAPVLYHGINVPTADPATPKFLTNGQNVPSGVTPALIEAVRAFDEALDQQLALDLEWDAFPEDAPGRDDLDDRAVAGRERLETLAEKFSETLHEAGLEGIVYGDRLYLGCYTTITRPLHEGICCASVYPVASVAGLGREGGAQ